MDGHLECESHVSHVSNVSHVSLMSSDDILMAYRQKSLLLQVADHAERCRRSGTSSLGHG